MKVWVVLEDKGFKCDVFGVYTNKETAMEKFMECPSFRSIKECEIGY